MTKSLLSVLFIVSASPCLPAGQGPAYKLLYSPPFGSNLGGLSGIFEGPAGVFSILSTWTGGGTGASIFKVTSGGVFSPVYAFPQGTQIAECVQDTNGQVVGGAFTNLPPDRNFYWSIDPSGNNLQEHELLGTWGPGFNTTVAPPDELYDIVARNVGSQTAFGFARITESGRITVLHQFSGSDGIPDGYSRLLLGQDGNLYGIGAQQAHGISPLFIYRFARSGTYSQVLTFPKVPGYDAFPLVAASDGYLYGTFSGGGVNNTGLIYRATLSGQYENVASLPANIKSPRTLMQAADGNLYGTTVYNTVFRYDLTTHAVTLVYQMDVAGSQGHVLILVEGMDGKLYGAAQNGGNAPGLGAVFSLDIGLPKPLPTVSGLYPASGGAGLKVLLWGNYLLGTTSVTFNGVPSTNIAATSVQSVTATVPEGATSGPVTITTANGSFTTATNFSVQ